MWQFNCQDWLIKQKFNNIGSHYEYQSHKSVYKKISKQQKNIQQIFDGKIKS